MLITELINADGAVVHVFKSTSRWLIACLVRCRASSEVGLEVGVLEIAITKCRNQGVVYMFALQYAL